MASSLDRRTFLRTTAAAAACVIGSESRMSLADEASENILVAAENTQHLFKISLAEWSFHRAIRSGKMDNLDFPKVAKQEFGIDCVEYVNQFFMDKATDASYLKELKKRCDDNGVRSGLIMCDNPVHLGDPDDAKRTKAVESHYPWVEAAKFLGCHSIRV